MKDIIVRVQSLEIEGFKSISKGTLVLDSESNLSSRSGFMHGNLKGIYGQNGSGKTSIIEIFKLLKNIWSGLKIHEYADLLSGENQKTKLKATFFILDEGLEKKTITKVVYTVELQAIQMGSGEKEVHIASESLESSSKDLNLENSKFGLKNSFKFTRFSESEAEFTVAPKKLKSIPGSKSLNRLQIGASMDAEHSSLFSKNGYKLLMKTSPELDNEESKQASTSENEERYKQLISSIEIIRRFSERYLRIIENKQISDGGSSQFFHLSVLTDQGGSRLISKTPSFEGLTIEEEYFIRIAPAFKQIDLILNALVPSVHFVFKDEKYTKPDGIQEVKIKFFTLRDGKFIPLENESEGIRRLVSVISEICTMFNERDYFLLIDEFDSGVFEYLLGELLEVIEENGKGQFLFTAHNLRPFEVLKPKNIILATADKLNRFIPMQKIQKNNNMRDVYYRMLALNDSDVLLYEKTQTGKIRNALFKAGKLMSESRE